VTVNGLKFCSWW